jgi:hypothetical protein
MSKLAKEVREKALELNLNPEIYGTIAEIGAGQEVSRNLFQAGAASGTIAKTISAYDKIISDIVYGKEESGRYVCESRVERMLDKEFSQLLLRLKELRSEKTRYFVFADTVATTAFGSDKPGKGWLGVRFQHQADAPHSQVLLSVVLKDKTAIPQQYIVGVLGVNLIHSCYYKSKNEAEFVHSLIDNLDKSRLELDVIEVSGPGFSHFDNRLLNLELVKNGVTESVFFNAKGEAFQPGDVFYKKHILVLRGSFRPPTLVSVDMLNTGLNKYAELLKIPREKILILAEITMNNLEVWGDKGGKDFVGRIELLGPLGLNVMISNYERHYRLSTYFRRFTPHPVAMVMGYYNLKEVLDEKNYQDLEGGILQSFGVLLNHEDKLLVYPYQEEGGKLLTSTQLEEEVPEKFKFLYRHLRKNNLIIDLEQANKDLLHIYSRKVLMMIESGDKTWESMVPPTVKETIKKSQLFGHG